MGGNEFGSIFTSTHVQELYEVSINLDQHYISHLTSIQKTTIFDFFNMLWDVYSSTLLQILLTDRVDCDEDEEEGTDEEVIYQH